MSLTRLDHLLLGTDDPDRTAGQIEALTGTRPTEAGYDEGLGVRTLLASLGHGAHLAVIGPDLTRGTAPQWLGLDRLSGTRLLTWAVSTTDLPDAAERLRDAGTDPGVVRSVTRRGPDGSVATFRMMHADPLPLGGAVPILVDRGEAAGPADTGDLPRLRLGALRLAGPDRPAIMRALYALDLEQDHPVLVEEDPAASVRARVSGPRGEMTM